MQHNPDRTNRRICQCGYCIARASAAIDGTLASFDARYREPFTPAWRQRAIAERDARGYVAVADTTGSVAL